MSENVTWEQRNGAATGEPAQPSFADLWQSTMNLYARFDLQPTEAATQTKLLEEVQELIEANVFDTDGGLHMCEEASDVIVTVMGFLIARGVTLDTLLEQVAHVIAKNDAKTHETHEVRDGLIMRRLMNTQDG